jgi:hypothetical protein
MGKVSEKGQKKQNHNTKEKRSKANFGKITVKLLYKWHTRISSATQA